MDRSIRDTAKQALSGAVHPESLCGSVFVGRAFMIELPAGGRVVVGRDADCDLQIGESSVSRKHAALEMHVDHAVVTDLGSRNGTRVNGEPLEGSRRVSRGDEIALGSARIALLPRSMVPAGVRAVLVRPAMLERIDAELAGGGDVEVRALRVPTAWYELDGIASTLAMLPASIVVGALGEQTLLLAGARAAMSRTPPLNLPGIEEGAARREAGEESSAQELVTAALREMGTHRVSMHRASQPVAASPAMVALYHEAGSIAPTTVSVLIIGETGVGKEVLAHFIHERSGRSGPLVCVNTAALPEALVESELFGHERGAFSGAHQSKVGLIEEANGGTLFLDEIGDLPMSTQSKLLRVLEDRRVRRVGSNRSIKVDVRVVAATHRDLERAVEENAFRRDLLFRLNACTLVVPPLRERLDELERLAGEFVAEASRRANRRTPLDVSDEAMELLRRHAWPGNVRELRNVIERGVALARSGDVLLPEHLPEPLRRRKGPPPLPPTLPHAHTDPPPASADVRDELREYERQRILVALASANGNQSEAAKQLGLPRKTLAYKMARLGIRGAR